MKNIILLLVGLLVTNTLLSQFFQQKRIELDTDASWKRTRFINVDNDAGLLLYQKKVRAEKSLVTTIIALDSDLNRIDSTTFSTPKAYNQLEYTFTKENTYIICYRSNKGEFQLTTIDNKTLKVHQISGTMPKYYWVESMKMGKERLFVLMNKYYEESALRLIDPLTGKFDEVYPGEDLKKKEYVSDNYLIKDNETEIHIQYDADDRYIYCYNENGELIREKAKLTIGDSKELLSTNICGLNNGTFLVTGRYLKKKEPVMFFTAVSNDYSTLKMVEETPVDSLAKRSEVTSNFKKNIVDLFNSEKVYNYKTAISHDVYNVDGKKYLVYEYYNTIYEIDKETRLRTVIGYDYSYALIVALDIENNVLWANYMNMELGYKPKSLLKFISVAFGNNGDVSLSLPNKKDVNFKTFNSEGETVNENSCSYLNMPLHPDVSMWKCYNWADSFVVTGYESVGAVPGRNVFFVSRFGR